MSGARPRPLQVADPELRIMHPPRGFAGATPELILRGVDVEGERGCAIAATDGVHGGSLNVGSVFVKGARARFSPATYDGEMPVTPHASATISFGLVSIPVKIYSAVHEEKASFNMLHKKCGSRVKQRYLCPTDNEIVERSDMVRGYEFAKDQYVKFTDAELKSLEAERSNAIELVEFVPESTVDLMYIESTDYLGPEPNGAKAYQLLFEAMKRTSKIAVGRYMARGKEHLVLLRPGAKGLVIHEVFYANEVRDFDQSIELGKGSDMHPAEIESAEALIESMTSEAFAPEKYTDAYQDRVTKAIDAKVAGQEVVQVTEAPRAQIVDLLEALKRSVAEAKRPGPAKAAPPKEEDAEPVKKRKAAR